MSTNPNNKSTALSIFETINNVEGFDPTPLAVDYTDLNTGETRKRLPVIVQIAWFRLKYPEGRIAISVTSTQGYFVATARIYKNYMDPVDCFLAEASASRGPIADKPTVSPREWAQTAAVGIALRNAGFGLQFHAAGEGFDDVAVNELGGIAPQTPASATPVASASKAAGTVSEEYSTEPEYSVAGEPVSETPAAEPEESPLDKAYKMPCPIDRYKGKTLKEVLVLDNKAIIWLAEKYTNDPEIAAGAKLICEYAVQATA